MRTMVGLVTRGRTFWYRRTIPAPIRDQVRRVMASGDHGLFDPTAPVSLKKSNARTEFWLSLDTFDHDHAKALVRRLDAEADRIFTAARQRLALQKTPPLQAVDDGTVAKLAKLFRHRKLAADQAKRRGDKPMSREQWAALGDEIEVLEAELRDANARGDCSAVEFDIDTFEACREAGINIVGSPLDVSNRIYLAFVEAWLEALEMIKARHAGTTVKTPDRPLPPEIAPKPSKVSVEDLLAGWKAERQPVAKTAYTFERQLMRFDAFLTGRNRSPQTATVDDVLDWKAALIKEGKSLKTVNNTMAGVKAVLGWAFENRRIPRDLFARVKLPTPKADPDKERRGYTYDEMILILKAARKQQGYLRWVPWILAFTGARLDEICQMTKSDVGAEKGISYLDLNAAEPGKHLKNRNSKRRVPIHRKLIDEGFLTFVEKAKDGPLFPELSTDRFGSRGGIATKKISKWIRKELKITDTRIGPNHSFRHMFKTICRNSGIPEAVDDAFTGHGRRTIGSRYGERHGLEFLSKEMAKIKVPKELD